MPNCLRFSHSFEFFWVERQYFWIELEKWIFVPIVEKSGYDAVCADFNLVDFWYVVVAVVHGKEIVSWVCTILMFLVKPFVFWVTPILENY